MLFATMVASIVLFKFSKTIGIIPESSFLRACLMALRQIGFQALFISKLTRQKQVTYIGNLMTISLMSSLILIPALMINAVVNLNEMALLA
jgi:hypothetical protein